MFSVTASFEGRRSICGGSSCASYRQGASDVFRSGFHLHIPRQGDVRWDKGTKKASFTYTLPPNDNLNKGARFGVDERNIYANSIYFFHVLDKDTGEVITERSSAQTTDAVRSAAGGRADSSRTSSL